MKKKKFEEQWASRWGLILAAIGMAVGTGNIWRFPRVAAANGGGAFMVGWIIALFVWSIPLLIAEAVLGKSTRMGVIGSFKSFLGEKYTWLGALVAWISLAIAFYYAVVMGWCVRYFVYAVSGYFSNPNLDTAALWKHFSTSPAQMILFHVISLIICVWVIYKGVAGGIEKANKFLIPALFIILVILAVYATLLPGSIQGYKYLFSIDLKYLANGNTWLNAWSQSAWSTGAGWGLLLTYYVYSKYNEDIVLNVYTTGLGNNSASIFAGIAVIGSIFALSPTHEAAMKAVHSGNTGLAFIHLSQLLTKMPGGTIFAILFFLALSFAALSSELSMIELGVRLFRDAGWNRKKAVVWMGFLLLILGLPSSANITILNNQDWVWGVGLMVSGFIIAWAMIKKGVEKVRSEYVNPDSDVKLGKWWSVAIYTIPVQFVILVGWWIWQAVTWYPKDWWHPGVFTHTYSVGTIIVQWVIAIIVAYLLNDWFAKHAKYPQVLQEAEE
ncbi:MAG: sodium-dependent transporter [Synergistetes bacterium]|nr:sodium-dependent transporter [Synergistota bacterium]